MSRIEIISASAGTGKTTRLAQIIGDRVGDGSVRPDAILATTFTRRAAAELAERARSKLLEDAQAHAAAGDEESASACIDRAQRLHAARIGTVNSVCGGLVQDFAFEQGLAPRVVILDEDQAKAELSRVAGVAVPAYLLAELTQIEQRLGFDLVLFIFINWLRVYNNTSSSLQKNFIISFNFRFISNVGVCQISCFCTIRSCIFMHYRNHIGLNWRNCCYGSITNNFFEEFAICTQISNFCWVNTICISSILDVRIQLICD